MIGHGGLLRAFYSADSGFWACLGDLPQTCPDGRILGLINMKLIRRTSQFHSELSDWTSRNLVQLQALIGNCQPLEVVGRASDTQH